MTVAVRDLVLARSGTTVLHGLTFDIAERSLTAIMGMSGAGKTTLLRCLAGLEPFDAGEIDVGGVKLCAGPRRGVTSLRGTVGLVFQSFELFPHLRVLENCVLAPMKVRGESRASAEPRARTLLDQLGLGNKCDAFPEHLSGGQRQRVAIARALAMEPRVLLYDEPTSALDPSLKHEVIETLRSVRKSGVTQIVVTHDVELARGAADHAVVLEAGRIVETGPPSEIFAAPRADATKRLLGATK